jgi:hypothetical protein
LSSSLASLMLAFTVIFYTAASCLWRLWPRFFYVAFLKVQEYVICFQGCSIHCIYWNE